MPVAQSSCEPFQPHEDETAEAWLAVGRIKLGVVVRAPSVIAVGPPSLVDHAVKGAKRRLAIFIRLATVVLVLSVVPMPSPQFVWSIWFRGPREGLVISSVISSVPGHYAVGALILALGTFILALLFPIAAIPQAPRPLADMLSPS